MNRDFQNGLINSVKYREGNIANAVEPTSPQRRSDVFCAEAQHRLQVMKEDVVLDDHICDESERGTAFNSFVAKSS